MSLPSVVASGRLDVEEAFRDAETFGAFEELLVEDVVIVSDFGDVNIDLDEAEGGVEVELSEAS